MYFNHEHVDIDNSGCNSISVGGASGHHGYSRSATFWVVMIVLALSGSTNGATMHTFADIVEEVAEQVPPSSNVRFPGVGQKLGGNGGATQLTSATTAAGNAALLRQAAANSAQICTRTGSCYGVVAETVAPASQAATAGSQVAALPIAHIVGGAILVRDVAEVYGERGGAVAGGKLVGGGATLMSSFAATQSCAVAGATLGPISSIVAGTVCYLATTVVGNAITDSGMDAIESFVADEAGPAIEEVPSDREPWVVEAKYQPTEDVRKRCRNLILSIEDILDANEGEEVITRLRAVVEEILGTNGNQNNALIPEECQHVALSVAQQRLGMVELSNSQWLDMLGDGSLLFSGTSNVDSRRQDLNMRAEAIVDNMISRGIYNIRTMDGHGRFVYAFLNAIQRRGLDVNDFTIDLYDINHNSNAWHIWFMPEGVMVLDENILASEAAINMDDGLAESVVYFNFCGMGEQSHRVSDNIYWITNSAHGQGTHVFVSWSVRGVTLDSDLGKYAEWSRSQGKYIHHRGDFYTYRYPKTG